MGFTVIQTIPTGTFDSAINGAIGVPFYGVLESGAVVQYKLSNGSDDTGWLNVVTVDSFTAFSGGEPTTLTIGLTPKPTSSSVESPSIRGFWVRST